MSRVKPCTRFRENGSACTNETDYADGWCRQQDCPGFPRPDPAQAPMSNGAPHGTAKHVRQTGALPTGDVTVEDVATVHITTRALDNFQLHHGGGEREAEVQLRTMLEDFLLKSARSVSKGGYLKLSREGYELILSPGRDTMTGYSTVHRERTWEQVKAGVKSRFKNRGKARTASGPKPETGPVVELSNFGTAFDSATVHLTAQVRSSYAKIAGLAWVSDEELDATIRAACAEFKSGKVVQRDAGCFEVDVADRIWLVAPDCRSLFGVKSAPTSRIPSVQRRARELLDVGTGPLARPSRLQEEVQTAGPEKLNTTKAAKRSNVKAARGSTTQAKAKRKKKSESKSFDDQLLEYWNSDRARERIDRRPKSLWLGLAKRVKGVTSGGLPGHGKGR
jgi:hypothetical protein